MGAAAREIQPAGGVNVSGTLIEAAQPLVLRGLAADWPVVRAGRQSPAVLLDYLDGMASDMTVLSFRSDADSAGRVFYNADMSGFNFERISCPLKMLLSKFREGDEKHLYLGSTSVEDCFPGFRGQNDLDLGEIQPLVSIWMGGPSRIAAHFDAPENMAVVVGGKRRFTLFPPDQLENLYVGPLDFTPAGQAISLVDFSNPDFERFPRFRDALDAAIVAELEPGDALYLPSMWWHHVEGMESFNILINYWWTTGQTAIGNPLNALIHGILAMRGLPAPQRDAWRGLFEHYVFADDADLEHIPEHVRGVLGDIDADMARKLRAMLLNKLGGS